MSGKKICVEGKIFKVPRGWSITNWSGHDLSLEGGEIVPSGGVLRVVCERRGDSMCPHLCRVYENGDSIIIGHLGQFRYEGGKLDAGAPYYTFTKTYLFMPIETALLFLHMVDLLGEKFLLFGVDQFGMISHLDN